MYLKKTLFALVIITILSFNILEKKSFEFIYPKQNNVKISLSSDHFKKFEKEWRGSDYYYYAEKDGFICSVLFYKLDEEEKLSLVEVPKIQISEKMKESGKEFPQNSPVFPYVYFKNNSNLKKMEENDISWGEMTDDFMFRKNEINLQGSKIIQNHMYGYAMFNNDLFVIVHLSKMNCTENELKEMEEILNSLKKVDK
ncbi:hypothetical protein [Flavobacterium sp. CF136]|uniref:hypothetical protein n=1 Tax=Flavobacterium sp. (strain CF136) TaxID=1144313 RepID=UPI0002718E13|nr:hypothetical protein [Flavobacterium sp. CF136]EJL63849.1 hypothetical protein PMI10_02220 [Flavobacterium sp. CF136]